MQKIGLPFNWKLIIFHFKIKENLPNSINNFSKLLLFFLIKIIAKCRFLLIFKTPHYPHPSILYVTFPSVTFF